jgi:hypothetical protein
MILKRELSYYFSLLMCDLPENVDAHNFYSEIIHALQDLIQSEFLNLGYFTFSPEQILYIRSLLSRVYIFDFSCRLFS